MVSIRASMPLFHPGLTNSPPLPDAENQVCRRPVRIRDPVGIRRETTLVTWVGPTFVSGSTRPQQGENHHRQPPPPPGEMPSRLNKTLRSASIELKFISLMNLITELYLN